MTQLNMFFSILHFCISIWSSLTVCLKNAFELYKHTKTQSCIVNVYISFWRTSQVAASLGLQNIN